MRRTVVARSFVLAALALALPGCPGPVAPPAEDAGPDAPALPDAGDDAGGRADAPDAPGAPCTDPDEDGDGVDSMACGGTDCDDTDPARAPGNSEICDAANVDEDCVPSTFGARDGDLDLHVDAACCNGTTCGDDCDDTRADVFEGQVETCDMRDNDCDGMTDETVERAFTRDADGDGFGSAVPGAETRLGCTPPTGFVEDASDCDDTLAAANPGATADICDALEGAGIDHDCDGTQNEGCACVEGRSLRCDDDTFGTGALFGVCAGGLRACIVGSWTECSILPLTETCDFRDEDCDGTADDGFLPYVTCYADPDDDGYPGSMVTMGTRQCRDPMRAGVGGCPSGTTNRAPITGNVDCAPLNRDVHPGATAFHATPYCPDPTMQLACFTAGGWFCVPTATPTCFASGLSASFDYDCDAALTREPAQACSPAAAACTAACGTSGFDYGAVPLCGASLDFVTCGGCAGGACDAPARAPRSIGCR